MKRKDANLRYIRLFLGLAFIVSFTGCEAIRSQLNSKASPSLAALAQTPAGNPTSSKISVNIMDADGSYTVQLDGPVATLGNVVSARKSSEMVGDSELVILKTGGTSYYIPAFFAISTDARMISVKNGDSVRFSNLSLLPTNVALLNRIKAANQLYEKNRTVKGIRPRVEYFPPDVYRQITGKSVPEAPLVSSLLNQIGSAFSQAGEALTGSGSESSEQFGPVPFIDRENMTTLLLVAKQRNNQGLVEKYSRILDEFDKEVGNEKAQVYATGILQGGNVVREMDLFDLIKDVYGGEKNLTAVRNKIPANIIVLRRGSSQYLIPFRADLATAKVPDSVIRTTTSYWNNQFVENQDTLLFTRLQLYTPVLNGLKTDRAKKVAEQLQALKSQQQLTRPKAKLTGSKRKIAREPGWLQTSLKRIPVSLPNFSLPNLRLF